MAFGKYPSVRARQPLRAGQLRPPTRSISKTDNSLSGTSALSAEVEGWLAQLTTDQRNPHDHEPADINGDELVNADDLIMIILALGACDCAVPCPQDQNLNGQVDADDLNVVILNWTT